MRFVRVRATQGCNFDQLRRNTDRFNSHRLAQFALAVALIITVKLVKWANRWEQMALAYEGVPAAVALAPDGGESLLAEALRRLVVQRVERHIAERPGEQPVRQRRVARQHGTVEVRPDDPALHRALAPVAGAIAHAGDDTPQCCGSFLQRRRTAVVLETSERRERSERGGVDLDEHLPHRRGPARVHRLDVEEPHALVRLPGGTRKGPPYDLESRAHRQDHGTARHAARQRPLVDQRLRGADLGPSSPPPRQ